MRPDVVVECGVAHGGALVLYASVLELLGKGHVVGVDVEIRKYNRLAIESHALSSGSALIEGDSVAEDTLSRVRSNPARDTVSRRARLAPHQRAHVEAELECLRAPGDTRPATSSSSTASWRGRRGRTPTQGPDWEVDNPLEADARVPAPGTGFESRPAVRPARGHVLPARVSPAAGSGLDAYLASRSPTPSSPQLQRCPRTPEQADPLEHSREPDL